MFADLGTIIYWWLTLMGIGLIFLPLTKKLFSNFFDQGYLFSKVFGVAISSYLVWLLASLKILPFYQETIWFVLIIGLLVNLAISSMKFPPPTPTSHPRPTSHFPPILLIFALEELMFFITLTFWSYIRGFQPNIQGLEKFMDFGFINSILRSKFFPPADIWFAGKSINYYYFGHYVTAFLTKATGINSAVTYNLMIATLFAFCFSLTFSLTGNLLYFFLLKKFENLKIDFKLKIKNLKLIIIGGLIAAFVISLGANLHPAYYNFKMKILKKPYCDGSFSYWYPNATRYIGYCPDVEDKTIHEFPAYSFVVSDLHGHVSDIPFVLTFLALCLVLFLKIKENKKLSFFSLLTTDLLLSLFLAIFFMTNQWDYPIYLLVLGMIFLVGFYQNRSNLGETLKKTTVSCLGVIFSSSLFFLPFQLNFEPMIKGIAFVHAHSRFYQLLILWGAPWFFGLSFLFFLFGKKIIPKKLLKKEKVKIKSSLLSLPSPLPTDIFILILFVVSTVLIIIPEIVFVKDIYITSYHRANTMFKLTYQAFIMFSLVIGYVTLRLTTSLPHYFEKRLFAFVSCFLILALLLYPLYSIPGYYGNLDLKNYKGLYGLYFLQTLYPDDYQTVRWLNNNVSGQPNILEAVGDSYTDYERISMATGLPTIEGWLVHEWLWRGSFDEPGKRATEVQTIYEGKDRQQTLALLQKYQIKYVIIGEMEKQKYPQLNETQFSEIGKVVFRSKTTSVYQLFQ